MKHISTLLLLVLAHIASAQVTLKVTSIPANTPAGSTIHVAGSFNGWSPSSTALLADGAGNYSYTVPEGTGTVEFKFTRGSWSAVEGNASGGYLPNRTFTFNGSPQTLNLTIASWEDLGSSGPASTAAANVHIISNNFNIPQLDRNRRVWIYLPPDYETSTKRYPVMYMHDGQNLFDNQTAFSGEWQVDETLNDLFAAGDHGSIVVGVDNGGGHRIREYTPWVNPVYGGGEGDAYATFLAETLKPFIDENYRTRREPKFNAVVGSSLGGLISTYTAVKYPEVFGKVGALSPAYWIVFDELNQYISSSVSDLSSLKIYSVGGETESASMGPQMQAIDQALQTKGLIPENSVVKIDAYGQHNEAYWRGEFKALYQWLFDEALMPVRFTDFSVQLVNCKIRIRWSATQEINHKVYCVERSTDGSTFACIGEIEGAGTRTGELRRHEYSDEHPLSGISYYRVRQTDLDQRSSLTAVQTVRNHCGATSVVLSPNPTAGMLHVKGLSGHEQLELYNSSGKLMIVRVARTANEVLDLSKLPAASYYLIIRHGESILLSKTIVKS